MAPPRQRPAGNTAIDDSRSEASSGTVTGHQSRGVPGPKPKKSAAAATSTTGTTASSKDLKVAAATGAAAAAAAAVGQNGGVEYGDGLRDDLPGV